MTAGRGDALAGGWSVFWNELLRRTPQSPPGRRGGSHQSRGHGNRAHADQPMVRMCVQSGGCGHVATPVGPADETRSGTTCRKERPDPRPSRVRAEIHRATIDPTTTREARMSITDKQSRESGATRGNSGVDLKLEVVVIPVSDADRSKEFYAGARVETRCGLLLRQRVPSRPVHAAPGSLCSIQFGTKITAAAPGSAHGLYLIVVRHRGRARASSSTGAPRSARCSTRATPGAQLAARRHERSRERPGPGSQELQLLCHVRRSGRKRLAAPRDHRSVARSSRPVGHVIQLGERPRGRAHDVQRQPTASTRSASARQTRIGPTGTPTFMVAEQAGAEPPT